MHYSRILFLVLGALALSNGDLTAVSVSEGPCISAPSHSDSNAWDLLLTSNAAWHVPMASKFYYRREAEILRGHSATNETDLEQMNLKLKCTLVACSLTGYGKRLNYVCYGSSFSVDHSGLITEFTCPATPGSTAVNWRDFSGRSQGQNNGRSQGQNNGYNQRQNNHEHNSNQSGEDDDNNKAPKVSILWNDRSNTIVASYCFDGQYRAFAVYSKNSQLDQNTQTHVNRTLVDAGFNPSHFQHM